MHGLHHSEFCPKFQFFFVENEETHGCLLSKHKGTAPPSHAGHNPDNCCSVYLTSGFKMKSFVLCPCFSDWEEKGGNATFGIAL